MTFGASIALLVLGAILAFAVDASVAGIELTTIGWILIAAGAVGLILGFAVMGRARRGMTATSRRTVTDGRGPARQEVVEREVV